VAASEGVGEGVGTVLEVDFFGHVVEAKQVARAKNEGVGDFSA
jgi:hypothetical protein